MTTTRTSRKRFLHMAAGTAVATAIGGAGAVSVAGAARSGAPTGSRQRLGMVVDTTRCASGCTECITACHATHNVPNIGNPKEEVKWVWKEEYANVLADGDARLSEEKRHTPVLTLCNHCDQPPCVRVCPTKATFKREDGIVAMDFHRCIGCRFCMAACPYGSRSFNFRDPEPYIASPNPRFPHRTRGVVEKCNFCAERLDRGLEPACVLACPSKALTFGDLNDATSQIRRLIDATSPTRRTPELGTEPSIYYLT